MNVLHIISSGGMYGAEAVILNLSRNLHRRIDGPGPHSSHLGVFTSESQPNHDLYAAALRDGVPAHPIPCRGQLDPSVLKTIRALILQLRIDVVHAHGYKADLYSYVALRSSSVPLVSTCHTWYDNDLAVRLYGTLDRWVLRHFDGVVAVSTEVRGRLLSAGVPGGKIRIIQNGIDLPPASQRDMHPNSSETLHVGLVGRLAPEKGCDLFLHAAAQVLTQMPQVQFSIAGEGSQRATLESLITSLGIEHNLRLLGRCDDMPAFYRSLDLLVSASRQEGLPVALLEGMAAGLPLVATRAGEVSTLLLNGVTGILVPIEDVPELASAMLTLLRDHELRHDFGAAGRSRIANSYSAENMSVQYLALYHQVVNRAESPRERSPQ